MNPKTQSPVGQTPSATPLAQAAPAVMKVPAQSNPVTPPVQKKSGSSKALMIFFVIGIVVTLGVFGYYLVTRIQQSSRPTTYRTATAAPTQTIATPTPKDVQEEVDTVDTSFPDAELNSIQTDLKEL